MSLCAAAAKAGSSFVLLLRAEPRPLTSAPKHGQGQPYQQPGGRTEKRPEEDANPDGRWQAAANQPAGQPRHEHFSPQHGDETGQKKHFEAAEQAGHGPPEHRH